MSKHTPGPWSAFIRIGTKTIEVRGGDGAPVVHWAGFDQADRKVHEQAANARLIAAAPDLLQFCETLHEWLASDAACEALPFMPEWYPALAAAIRKAKGGQP